MANLKALPTPTWRSADNLVWSLQSQGSYNESFLQWPKAFESLPVKGEILAAVPNRGVLLASPLENFDALVDAAQKSLQELPWPLSGTLFKILDNRIDVFNAPERQAQLNSLSNLSMQSTYKAQQEALRSHCEAIDEDVFIATSVFSRPRMIRSRFNLGAHGPKGSIHSYPRQTSSPSFATHRIHERHCS